MASSMVKVFLTGMMGVPSMDTLSITTSRVKESIVGKMADVMKAVGWPTKLRVKVSLHGQMAVFKKDITRTIRNMARASSSGKMGGNT